MMKYLWLPLLLLIFGGCHSTPPLQKVPMHSMYASKATCKLPSAPFEAAITAATTAEDWSAEQTGRSSFSAHRSHDTKATKIAISFTDSVYYLSYLDSRGMGYDGQSIDVTYNQWLRDLKRTIDKELLSACKAQPIALPKPPVVPQPKPKPQPLMRIDSPLFIETVPTDLQRVH